MEYILIDNFNGNINIICKDDGSGEPLIYDSLRKAEELVGTFLPYAHESYHDLTPAWKNAIEKRQNAIECAIACVDEILKAGSVDIVNQYFNDRGWLEVKKELEAL